MSTDNFDSLDDAALAHLFALEVVGWTFHPESNWPWDDERGEPCAAGPEFYLTDANAVLPLIAKYTAETDEHNGGEPMVFRIYSPAGPHDVWTFEPHWMHHDGTIPWGEPSTAPTFARAACLALLRSKREIANPEPIHIDADLHPEDAYVQHTTKDSPC